MTTADTAAARPSAWQRFRAWRRGRPFWGGLVAIVAGLEIYATSQTSIGDMEIKIGPGGMAAYVIPLMLVAAGLLSWFTPAQRHFYGIIVPAISIYALLEINFGGWIFGTILGMVGGALIFAWTEDKGQSAAAEAGVPEDGGENADDDDHAPRHAALDELFGAPPATAIPRQGTPDPVAPAPENHGGSGRTLAAVVAPLLLVLAIGIVAAKGSEAAYAAPCRTGSTAPAKVPVKPVKPAVSTKSSPKAGSSTASPAPAASPSESAQPGLLSRIVGGIVHLLDPSPSPTADPEPTTQPEPSASAQPDPQPTAGTPKPPAKPKPRKSIKPCTATSPSPAPAKQLKAAAGQPDVAATPSRLTGSKVTMTNLVFQGIVDLPTVNGPITVLKFTMDSAVTDDFSLLTHSGGSHTRDIVFRTSKLTVKQNVSFYASRFQGKALGLIPVDYTPQNTTTPIPLTPIPIPIIYFTDPDIQLVWVTSDVLTGTPTLTSTFA